MAVAPTITVTPQQSSTASSAMDTSSEMQQQQPQQMVSLSADYDGSSAAGTAADTSSRGALDSGQFVIVGVQGAAAAATPSSQISPVASSSTSSTGAVGPTLQAHVQPHFAAGVAPNVSDSTSGKFHSIDSAIRDSLHSVELCSNLCQTIVTFPSIISPQFSDGSAFRRFDGWERTAFHFRSTATTRGFYVVFRKYVGSYGGKQRHSSQRLHHQAWTTFRLIDTGNRGARHGHIAKKQKISRYFRRSHGVTAGSVLRARKTSVDVRLVYAN